MYASLFQEEDSLSQSGSWSSEDESHLVPPLAIAPGVQEETNTANLTTFGLSSCLGPAVPWLRRAAVLSLLAQIGTLLLTWATSECRGSAAQYNTFVSWIALLPVAIFRAYAEWQGITHSAAPFVALGGKFAFLGCALPFWLWIFVYGSFSMLNLADIGTDSMFTAVMLRTKSCSDQSLSVAWVSYWKQSVMGWLFPAPSLDTLALVSWFLSLVQVVWPIAASLRVGDNPCNDTELKYEIGDWGNGDSMTGAVVGESVIFYHDGVAFMLAEAGGLSALQKMSIEYCACGAKAIVENDKGGDTWRNTMVLSYLTPMASQMATRVAASWLLENALQLNLQTSEFALMQSLVKRNNIAFSPVQSLVSISLSLFTTLLKFAEAREFFKVVHDYMPQIDEVASSPSETDQGWLRSFWRSLWIVRLGCVALLAALCWSVAKLIGAFVCDESLLNFTGCAAFNMSLPPMQSNVSNVSLPPMQSNVSNVSLLPVQSN